MKIRQLSSVWDKLFLISPAWRAALNNNSNIAFSGCWERLTVAWTAPQNASSDTESSCNWEQQLQLSFTVCYQQRWGKSVFLLYLLYITLTAEFHPSWLAETCSCESQMRSCHHHVLAAPLWKKDPSCYQDNRRSSFPNFLQSLLPKVFHYEPFFFFWPPGLCSYTLR